MWTHFTALPHLFIQLWRSVILACFSQKSLQKLTSYEGQTQQHAYVGSRFSTLFSYKLCHRGHRAKSITLKQDCLQFDPSVFTGQRRSRISLLLLPLHSLSPSLSLSLFFLFFCRSWTKKKKKNPNQQHTNTHPPSLSVSAEKISCPSAVFTGSPGVKTNTGHGLKERAAWEGGVASRPECSESTNEP